VESGFRDLRQVGREPQIQALRAEHGPNFEKWWQQSLGFGFECLTRSQARYLDNTTDAQTIRIDLLRQDLQAALKLLGQGEIDDAHALMRDQGFRPDDFIWYADPSPGFPSAVRSKVTMVRKSAQVNKTYEADDAPSWLLLFENDLKQGAFG
jgi:hypothetical protein